MTLLAMCHINLSLDPNRLLEYPNLFLKVHLLLRHCVSKPGVCPMVANHCVTAGFLSLGTADFGGWIILCSGGLFMFSGIPFLPDTRSTSPDTTTKNVSTSPEGKMAPR